MPVKGTGDDMPAIGTERGAGHRASMPLQQDAPLAAVSIPDLRDVTG
jgi:hypothetical protein